MASPTSITYRRAAIWAARAEGGDLTATQDAAMQAWLRKDPRNLGAYLQCRAALARVERLRDVSASNKKSG